MGMSFAKWKRSIPMPAVTMKMPVKSGRPRGPIAWNESTTTSRNPLKADSMPESRACTTERIVLRKE